MTDQTPDRLDRIRKLLAKAERAGTPQEAETFTAKAVELMARHGVDDAMLAASQPAGTDPIGRVRIEIQDPYSAGKARLLGWTASAMRCRWVMHDARGGKVGAVTVFGHASDRARVELLYTSLLLQIARPLSNVRPFDPGESVAAYRRSWLYGFAARIHQRLRAAETTAAQHAAERSATTSGAQLVLADRSAAVDLAYAHEFGTLRKGKTPQFGGSGYARGVQAADKARLGQDAAVPGRTRAAVGGAR